MPPQVGLVLAALQLETSWFSWHTCLQALRFKVLLYVAAVIQEDAYQEPLMIFVNWLKML